jgi:hypothetical protein
LDEKLEENKQLIKGFIFEKYYGQISAIPLAGKYLQQRGKKTVFFERSVFVKSGF